MTAPVALTIAGSDPSGGAGVQADLRTFGALGVTGVSAVSALTAQNSLGVQAVYPVDPAVLAAQLEALFSDTPVQAVKIGMLGGAAQVRVVADALRRFSPPHVVLDTVLASTGGVPLLDDAGCAALASELVPLCDLVTPNTHEGRALDLSRARAVLYKGGHLDGEPNDTLVFASGRQVTFPGARIPTPHTHGTGCFLSAAIAALLARGASLEDAAREAKGLLARALLSPIVIGQGRGYPSLAPPVEARTHAERLCLLRGVYVVTDSRLRPDRSHEAIAEAALAGGASVIQLREKTLPTPALITLARRLRGMTEKAGALLMMNDRVDIALASDADGVHLGPDDMTPADARRLLGPDKLIGVSTGTVAEARAAAPFASYFGVGAIYGSTTKGDAGAAVGLERIREIKAALPSLPLVAIGGIGMETIAEVGAAGVDMAAVISAVVLADDMTAAVRALQAQFSLAC